MLQYFQWLLVDNTSMLFCSSPKSFNNNLILLVPCSSPHLLTFIMEPITRSGVRNEWVPSGKRTYNR